MLRSMMYTEYLSKLIIYELSPGLNETSEPMS